MKSNSQTNHISRWDTAIAAGEANPEPGTGDLLVQLAEAAAGAKNCIIRRAALTYQAQQNSRDLDAFMAAGKEAFSRLALIIKGSYGPRSEQVIAWAIQPLRPAQKSKLEPPPLPEDKQPENGQSPAQAA